MMTCRLTTYCRRRPIIVTQGDIQVNLPLSESTFFILISLAAEPKHGYAILKDVESLSASRIILSTGTLYGALKRLLEQGWIRRAGGSDSADTGRPRRAYALTALGRRILDAEVARLHNLVETARLRSVGERA
ncbi:MAG TPA: helix-turn-helix transcriptional regulator [Anaerolineae bacterium]|nr:helix-turn-helix transcriptional regulator [Anaerolineae bacterium]